MRFHRSNGLDTALYKTIPLIQDINRKSINLIQSAIFAKLTFLEVNMIRAGWHKDLESE